MNIKDRIINGVRLGDVEKGPVNEMKELLMQANAEGTALLENNGMLPLKNGEKIAIFGRCQFEYYKSGSGSGGKVNAPYVTQIYDSIKALNYVEIDEVISKIYRDWIEENPFDFAGGWCLPYSQKEPVLTDEEVEMAANRNDKAIVISEGVPVRIRIIRMRRVVIFCPRKNGDCLKKYRHTLKMYVCF